MDAGTQPDSGPHAHPDPQRDLQSTKAAAVAECVAARFSCRAFRPDPLPRSLIARILESAQQTASWCNAQPWQIWLLSGAALERLRGGLLSRADADMQAQLQPAQSGQPAAEPVTDFPWPRAYQGVYLDRRRRCGFQLYESVGIARGDRLAAARQARENFRFFGAPHVAIVTSDEALGTYGAVDCGAYVSQFMLVARSLDVDSIAQAAVGPHARWIRSQLAIPDDRRVVCAISFGLADREHPANRFRTERAGLDQAITWLDD